jgi:hypothetical protein
MDRRATEGAYLIDFGGRCIDYRFRAPPPPHHRHHHRRQRALGSRALRAPWREVEAFLRQKERWIKRKLDEWARLPRPAILRGHSGESLPLFGSTVTLEVQNRRPARRAPPPAPAAGNGALGAARAEGADRSGSRPKRSTP